MMSPPKSIFISHASADDALARTVAEQLRAHGFDAWLDEHVLQPGASWREELSARLDSSDVFVVLVTEDSQHSPWVRWELSEILKRAWDDNQKVVLPVIVGSADVPGFLRDHLALRVESERSFGLEELLRWLSERTLPGGVSRSEAGETRLGQRLAELESTAASLAKTEEEGA